jgi:hypothetical protein
MIEQNPGASTGNDLNKKIDILHLEASPYPDRRRVKVIFQLSPFTLEPNALISMVDRDGKLIASVNIVNIFVPENEITLHVAERDILEGEYEVKLDLFHIVEEDIEDEDQHVLIRQAPINSAVVSFSNP